MTMLTPDTPVMVEWYTYGWIPRRRHMVIVPAGQAAEWHAQGVSMLVHSVDPALYRECGLGTKTRQ